MDKLIHLTQIFKLSIMETFSLYSKYFIKLGISLKSISTSPTATITSGTIIATTYFSTVQKALLLLMIFFILDFITGIVASWKEKKKEEKEDPSLKEQSLISSEKLKLSAIKAFTYASSILGVWGIEKVFFIKTFKFENVSTEDLTVTLIFVGFCCAIEFYSIVFENFKRMGFDIAKSFIKVVKGVKKIVLHTEN
jgi:phage-related holin